jgi:serine/threonine-protein kinase RsbT
MADELRVPIGADSDLVNARATARRLALSLGFSETDATLIATAISEVARNIVVHAGCGEINLRSVDEETRSGLVVVATDDGPGIADYNDAVEPGFTSWGGLGLGLPGARRLMDEFEINTNAGSGTTVTMTKWRMKDELERLRERRMRRG